MKVSYYPGCTLKTKAQNLEESARASLAALDVELEELPRWNCCGAVFSQSEDDLLHMIAPVRDLIRVAELGRKEVVTTCSMCYNTLARANEVMRTDEVKRKALNSFMEEEIDYHGDVRVMHLLTFLKERVGFEALARRVKRPLSHLKAAPYYGCTLVRPESISIDAAQPRALFEDFLLALGAEPVKFPAAAECCSSYQILSNPGPAMEAASNVLKSAAEWGAELLVMSCPLCEYTLGKRQDDVLRGREGARELPTLYFTQLLAIALDLPEATWKIELNHARVMRLLEKKDLLKAAS